MIKFINLQFASIQESFVSQLHAQVKYVYKENVFQDVMLRHKFGINVAPVVLNHQHANQ